MMKWRVARKNSSDDSEVKSSLDLLDSVLAEYEQDDDEEVSFPFNSWLTTEENKIGNFSHCRQSKRSEGVITYRHSLPSDVSQLKKIPPRPPVRSPNTRLSCSDPYSYQSLPRPVPIYVGHPTTKRSASLPERPAMTTFGHVSPHHSTQPSDALLESRSKAVHNDFRQSLHFDVFAGQTDHVPDHQERSDLLAVEKRKKSKWKRFDKIPFIK